MRLDEWRALLDVDDQKSRDTEDFWAVCPCHSDHEASLHVKIGDDGQIVMKCFACGADRKDVAEALGYQLRDVAVDARTGEPPFGKGKGGGGQMARKPKERKTCRPYTVGEVWQLGKKGEKRPYKLETIYEYQLADGAVRLRKARLECRDENGNRIDKTFCVQSLDPDGKWYSDDGIYKNLMYHLPEVKQAIEAGGTIFLVEGEKDVESMRLFGYTATCNLYGASRGKVGDKWKPDHTKQLEGAKRVIVMPDNDRAGEMLAQHICKQLQPVVGEVRILRLSEEISGFEEKGDFTDYVLLRKRGGMNSKSALRAEFDAMVERAPVWTPDNVMPFPEEEKRKTVGADGFDGGSDDGEGDDYFGVYGYCVRHGRLCKKTRDGARPLCDFVPEPKETITRDDGVEAVTEYIIGGTFCDGKKRRDAHVLSDDEFYAMRWPLKAWQFAGNISSQNGAEKQVREAIMKAGQMIAKHRTIYSHTGIKVIDGVPCYLYAGGAIGVQDVSVELKNNLRYYDLTPVEGLSEYEASASTYMLMNEFPARISIPTLAQAFLAPLYSVLEEMEEPPSYVLYMRGQTGTFKSTFVGYVLSHFGRYYNRRFTATFQETFNQAREKTFYAKDALYVVDDYNPQGDKRAMAKMDAIADAVITAIADRAERGGLGANREMKAEKPARCTCIMTGEQLPNLNQGRVLRLYIIDVARGEIAQDARSLEPYAQMARQGDFRTCMHGYIAWLLSRWDGMKDEIYERLEEAKDIVYADEALPQKYARMLATGAQLLLGAGLMIDYLRHTGVEERDRGQMLEHAWAAIRENIIRQGDAIDEATPARRYIAAVQSLIRMQTCRVIDMTDTGWITQAYRPGTIGWMDEDYYYLETGATDRAVRMLWKDTGTEVGMNDRQIRSQMLECGLLEGGMEQGRITPTCVKRIGRQTPRVMKISKWVIEGSEKPKAPEFKPVEGQQEELPFD